MNRITFALAALVTVGLCTSSVADEPIRVVLYPEQITAQPGQQVLLSPILMEGDSPLSTWPEEFLFRASGKPLSGHLYTVPSIRGIHIIEARHPRAPGSVGRSKILVPLGFRAHSLSIVPATPKLLPGSSVTFTARAHPKAGRSPDSATPVAVEWTLDGPGTLDPFSGRYTAPPSAEGQSATVQAHGPDGVRAQCRVQFLPKPSPQHHLTLHPDRIEVDPGEIVQFKIILRDGDQPIPLAPWKLQLTATRGSFTGTRFRAPDKPGPVTITAQLGNDHQARAIVEVIDHGPAQLALEPATARVAAGETIRFTVRVLDRKGLSIPPPPLRWSASSGTITSDGTFRAPYELPGEIRIEVREPERDLAATARVETTPAVPAQIEIEPAHARIEEGATIQFRARVLDRHGHSIDHPHFWSADGGTIDESGRFTASRSTTGSAKVEAHIPDTSIIGSAPIKVVAPTPWIVKIDPDQKKVRPGQIIAFHAWLERGNKKVPTRPWEFHFECDSAELDGNQFVAPARPGEYRIRAIHPRGKAVARVVVEVVTPPIARVEVRPNSVRLRPEETIRFEALFFDSEDQRIEGLRPVWSAQGGTIDESGLFRFRPESNQRAFVRATTAKSSLEGLATVLPRSQWQLRVKPTNVRVQPGKSLRLRTTLHRDKILVEVKPWEIERQAVRGKFEGEIYFAPATPGIDTLTFRHSRASAKVQVVIEADPERQTTPERGKEGASPGWTLQVEPGAPVMAPGGSVQFETRLLHNGRPAVLWPWDLRFEAADGGVFAGSRFTPPARPGRYRVRIVHPRASSNLFVEVQGTSIDRVEITPERVRVEPGHSLRFRARALDARGQNLEATFVWQASEGAGQLHPDGFFTAGQKAGEYTIEVRELNSGRTARGTILVESTDPTAMRERGRQWGASIRHGRRNAEQLARYIIAFLFFRKRSSIDAFRTGFLEAYPGPRGEATYRTSWKTVLFEYGRYYGQSLQASEVSEVGTIRFVRNQILRFGEEGTQAFGEGFSMGHGEGSRKILSRIFTQAKSLPERD